MRSGMTVDANLIVARREAALLVPSSAVRNGQVWLLADGRLHRKPVAAGATGAAHTEIRSGLSDTDVVVVSPAENLREGQRAHGKPAASSISLGSPLAQR